MTVILHALFIYVAYAVSYRSSEEILPSLRDHAAAEFVHHTGSTWPHGGPHHPAAGPARCPPDLGQQLPHWQYRGLLDHRTAERIPTRMADDGAYGGKYRLSKPPQCCRVTMSNCRYSTVRARSWVAQHWSFWARSRRAALRRRPGDPLQANHLQGRPIAALRPRPGAALQHPYTRRSCLARRDRRVTVCSAGQTGRSRPQHGSVRTCNMNSPPGG